jgi:hypothetical protein
MGYISVKDWLNDLPPFSDAAFSRHTHKYAERYKEALAAGRKGNNDPAHRKGFEHCHHQNVLRL